MQIIRTKFVFRSLALLVALGFWISSCKDINSNEDSNLSSQVKFYDREVAYQWTQMFLNVERYAAGFRPGSAPRAWAHMSFAAYEACIDGMPDFNSLAPLYVGLDIPKADPGKSYHYPTVVNAVYSTLLPQFLAQATAQQKTAIAELKAFFETKYRHDAGDETFERSKVYGEAVAAAVWAWSESDVLPVGKANQVYLDPFAGYDWQTKYSKNGDWKPTFPGPGKAMYPQWGKVRTFALKEAQKLCRPPQAKYSESTNSAYYAQAIEVYAQNTPTWSYDDEWVAEFWSDDLVGLTFSPGPRWLAIGNQVLEREKSNLETALYMHAKVGMAVSDASVGCWNSKYHYNIERPQTYINRFIDPDWKPGLSNPLTGDQGITPSFPAYPSGHSTMGAAGAEALGSIFGYNYAMTDNCHRDRTEFSGTPRSFNSFAEMAEENAWSRVPLGVHWRMDSEEGLHFGAEIAREVSALPWKK